MIEVRELTMQYGPPNRRVTVLDHLDFSVDAGEVLAVVGPSGAGKSTLAQCVNLLERPTTGSVVVNGQDLTTLSERELRTARRKIGTVFQSSSLLSRRTVAQNVALPLQYLGVTRAEQNRRVGELLDRVGLGRRGDDYPFQLSGGQRQRVKIARALALRPSVLLSDEATSGLDPQTTASVTSLLTELKRDLNLAIVFITHEMDTVLTVADSVARLDHGRIVESGRIVDLLTDHSSSLGHALGPGIESSDAPAGEQVWNVTYNSSTVPADWVSRLGAELAVSISLLGAWIQVVAGVSVGRATLGIRADKHDAAAAALTRLGLSATVNAIESTLEVAS